MTTYQYRLLDGETGIVTIPDDAQPGSMTVASWGGDTGYQCDAWLDSDGGLWLPSDGQSALGDNVTEDGKPDPRGGWYYAATGQPAIIGLPGEPLTRLA